MLIYQCFIKSIQFLEYLTKREKREEKDENKRIKKKQRNYIDCIGNHYYNKGTVEGTTNVGSVIGEQTGGNDNLSKLYYLSTLNLGRVNGQDVTDKVIGVSDEINSYEDFLTWIESK